MILNVNRSNECLVVCILIMIIFKASRFSFVFYVNMHYDVTDALRLRLLLRHITRSKNTTLKRNSSLVFSPHCIALPRVFEHKDGFNFCVNAP